jgi:hypothetical protein
MTRVKQWEKVLAAQLKAARSKSFEWGVFDCCLFAADVVQALTGVDLMSEFRGKYDTELSAYRLIRTSGGDDLYAAVSKQTTAQGMTEINPRTAQRGDLVLVNSADRQAMGVVGLDGRFAVCAAMPSGVTLVAMPDWLHAWRTS